MNDNQTRKEEEENHNIRKKKTNIRLSEFHL